jgi:predicted nucleic acid-binding protein
MSAKYFFDSNIFIYQLDISEPKKSKIASQLINEAIGHGNACISYQVVQECLNIMLRKARIAVSTANAQAYLETVLLPLVEVSPTASLYTRGMTLFDRYGFSFYDSLIVAAALEAGCATLYTEDLQSGLKIESLVILNPFS